MAFDMLDRELSELAVKSEEGGTCQTLESVIDDDFEESLEI